MIKKTKTKVVATLGPASNSATVIKKLIRAGVNVARLNFSHGDHEIHKDSLDHFREAAKSLKTHAGILQDLSGPKIRVGEFENGKEILKKGQIFTLTNKKFLGTKEKAFVNYKRLPKEVKKGSPIMIFDGKIHLEVVNVTENDIVCKVLVGGEISNRKGVNVPGANLSLSSLTAKDKKDVLFGIKHKVEFVALSFVRRAKDVRDLRKILVAGKSKAMIVSKIETQEAVENIDEIIKESDGVMVARGDLAVEIGPEFVPTVQKSIIEKCNTLGKPVITATQMLDSMENAPVPTRAEVSDVANAILDGTDAIMLSGETATGDYPVEAVEVMSRIAETTEEKYKNTNLEYLGDSKHTTDAVTSAVVRIANNVRARTIVALTASGFTPRLVSRYKPHHAIVAISSNDFVCNQLSISYGVESLCVEISDDHCGRVEDISKIVRSKRLASKGEKVVISAGIKPGKAKGTNMLFVIKV